MRYVCISGMNSPSGVVNSVRLTRHNTYNVDKLELEPASMKLGYRRASRCNRGVSLPRHSCGFSCRTWKSLWLPYPWQYLR